jgi:hypothetical protein
MNKIFILLIIITSTAITGCKSLKRELNGDKSNNPKFDQTPYNQIYAGKSVGEFTYTTTLAYVSGAVETKWTYYKWVRVHNPSDLGGIYYEQSCSGNSYSDNFPNEQIGRNSPYAIVSMNGLNLSVTFKGMNQMDEGCWSIKSIPMSNLMESSHDLY